MNEVVLNCTGVNHIYNFLSFLKLLILIDEIGYSLCYSSSTLERYSFIKQFIQLSIVWDAFQILPPIFDYGHSVWHMHVSIDSREHQK